MTYVYSHQDIIEETEGTATKEYIYGNRVDDLLAMTTQGKTYWYAKDIR